MDESKPQPKEYYEGEQAARNFEGILGRALTTSPSEVKKRHQQWEKKRKGQKKQSRA